MPSFDQPAAFRTPGGSVQPPALFTVVPNIAAIPRPAQNRPAHLLHTRPVGQIGISAFSQGTNQLPITRHPLPTNGPGKGEEDGADKEHYGDSDPQAGHISQCVFDRQCLVILW